MNWNDLRLFLAVAAAGSFVAAGQVCGVHETTVARGVARLERALGRALFLRPKPVLTPFGAAVRSALSETERGIGAVAALAARGNGPVGPVRLAAVSWVVCDVLLPQVSRLQAAAPGVDLSLIASEARTEPDTGAADLALRFARPADAAATLLTRRLAEVPFGLFGAPGAEGWIGYDAPDAGRLAQAAWIGGKVCLRVSDLVSARAAVVAGLGLAHLPMCLGPPGMLRARGPWSREIWLLRHPARRDDAAVAAVADWLDRRVTPVLAGIAARPHET